MDPSASNPNALAKTLTVALVVFVIGGLVMNSRQTSTSAAAQEERVFENKIPSHIPIKIKIKKEKEQSFKDLKNEKWLSEFEIEITNTGDKPIYFLYITFITDVKFGGQRLVFPMSYGRAELGDIVSKAQTDDIPIKPGDTHVLQMGEVPAWEKGVREQLFPQATKFRAELQSLSFGDGTGYFGTEIYPPANKKQSPSTQIEQVQKVPPKISERPRGKPRPQSTGSFTLAKPTFLSANFLSETPTKHSDLVEEQPITTCESPCVTVTPWSGNVCYDNLERSACKIQNRPNPNPDGVCRELVYDSIACTAGTVNYFCQTITLYECGLAPAPTPTPSPTPSPQPCTYCADPNASPADCSDPSKPKCNAFLFEYEQNGCCYRQTCERAGIVPPPPQPCPDGFFRSSPNLQPFPMCNYLPCIPKPPGMVTDPATCQFLGYYWNFTSSACGTRPAIGMCGGGADWGNYFTTGCYTGLGLFSGVCDRSTAFKSKCMLNGGDYNAPYCVCSGCDVCGGSPILIDINGDGFAMTGVAGGVSFDLNGNGTRDPLSWTAPGTDDAWLALDRNGNGTINNGQELFGDLTLQPASPLKNGFLALAEFNLPHNGGNADAVIDKNDAVFHQLRLWQDKNHNGISEPSELQPLQNAGIKILELEYKMSKQIDRYGNEFKYRAKVKDTNDTKIARWAWDVFLQSVGL